MLAGATLLCSNAVDPGETLDLLEAEKPTMTNGFVAGIAAPRPSPEPAAARPVVDAPREPVPDHGAGCATRRPRAAPHHARDDRDRQRHHDQRGRDPTNPNTGVARSASRRRGSTPRSSTPIRVSASTSAPIGEFCVRGAFRDAAVLQTQPRGVLRRRRMVSHRRSRPHRRGRLRLLHRQSRRDDQDRGRQRRTGGGGEGHRQGHRPGPSHT